MLKLSENQKGFIPMMVAIIAVVLAIILFAFLKVRAHN